MILPILTLTLLAYATSVAGYCFPVYGAWVGPYKYSTSSFETDEAFAEMKAQGVNRIYFDVYANGILYAKSSTAEANGVIIEDRLSYAVTAANKHGLELYAWFEYGTMAQYGQSGDTPSSSFAVEADSKGWLLKNYVGGKPVYFTSGGGSFMYLDPTNSQVRSFIANMAADVMRNYDIKGVQFDDHFSAPNGFATIDAMSQSSLYTLMDNFMIQIRDAVKGAHSGAILSFAPSPLAFARSHANVDWADWISRGIVMDAVAQYYYTTAAAFLTTLNNDIANVASYQAGLKAGIRLSGSSSPVITPQAEVDEMIQIAYQKGLKGISFWKIDNLIEKTYTHPTFTKC